MGVGLGSVRRPEADEPGPRRLLFCVSASNIAQAVALPVGFEDIHPMGESVQQSAGEPFGTEHFDPVLKGQVGGDDEAGTLVSAADHVKEQFGTGLGKGDVTEFVEDE